ncbi:MAG: glycosyl hydrolase, partial [Bacteroidota bacterium]
LVEFQRKVAESQRAVLGASRAVDDLKDRIGYMKKALQSTHATTEKLRSDLAALEVNANDIIRAMRGDRTLSSRNEPTPPSIVDRVNGIVDDQWQSSGAPTQTQIDAYNIVGEEFAPVLGKLRTLVQTDLKNIEMAMENSGAPWTPGRVPEWRR